MKKYSVTIKFITDYLQAKFTEDAKKELENYVSQGIVKSAEDGWKVLQYFDEKGIYIPSDQLRHALVKAGRELKLKKQRRSLENWVISNLIVSPEKIYLDKIEPDKVSTSYPMRKDGNRVKIQHPVINAGQAVKFEITILDDMEDKTIKQLVEICGKNCGIGARRRDMYGRYEIVSFK
jgi:hypothetical protein